MMVRSEVSATGPDPRRWLILAVVCGLLYRPGPLTHPEDAPTGEPSRQAAPAQT
jgi:hypothetical protein